MKRLSLALAGVVLSIPVQTVQAVDQNSNRQSDVWEMMFGATGLTATGDADGDGWSNVVESAAGTDPLSGSSFPGGVLAFQGARPSFLWQSKAGKRYTLLGSGSLEGFTPAGLSATGTGGPMAFELPTADGNEFFKMQIEDLDTDADGVNDWEELTLGFDPTRQRTSRFAQTDSQRVVAGLAAGNEITVSTYDESCWERWPDPGMFVIRRGGGLNPLQVSFVVAGSAVRGVDYQLSVPGTVVSFAPGQREALVKVIPIQDSEDAEPDEDVLMTVNPAPGYNTGTQNSATVTIFNQTAASGPSPEEAARFLIQAAFGPDQDLASDADQIPQNVQEVMGMGIPAWIDDQLTRPVGYLQPMVKWQKEMEQAYRDDETGTIPDPEIYNDKKQNAWWGRAMGLPKLRPDMAGQPPVETQLPDPLRQRVAFALSQIFVISDRMERLAVEPEGMAHFYDRLLANSFLNYRQLIEEVSLHPCMGIYLSHMGNKKADPVAHTFPDENYAREVMQLFSIGLWMLNPDGTRQLDSGGNPIPTYSNADITELARVFTGLHFARHVNGAPNVNFDMYDGDFTTPMKGFDLYHDLGPKNLLGTATPARTANGSAATQADIAVLMDTLFNHPNVGPFLGRQLIQRLVTSNPSPEYVGRVAAAFNSAPRGNLGRVVKAILTDPEARNSARMTDPAFGKLREPFLRAVNVARAFNATSPNGWYYLDAFSLDHVQEPMKAPSVFNFYLPTYSPPGALAQAGLVSPELQIVNASSGTTAPNYFWGSINGGLHRWGVGNPMKNTSLNLTQEMLMNVPSAAVNDPGSNLQPLDPDPLIRRLDLVLTGGTLEPESLRIIREALMRIGPGSGWDWPKNRLKLAIYLIVASPEFAVQH